MMNRLVGSQEPKGTDGILSCEIVRSFEDLTLTPEEWDQFILSSGNDIYFSFDWCKVWWKHYGGKRKLRILLLRNDNCLVGILPMIIDRFFIGLTWFTLAKMIGSDFTLSVLRLPILDAYVEQIYEIVLDQMCLNEKCDALWFGPIADEDLLPKILRDVYKQALGDIYIAHDQPMSCHTDLKLPDKFEEYLSSLHAKQRRNYNAGKNRLNKSFNIVKSVISDTDEVIHEFDNFIERHTIQWKNINKLGHFLDWPGAKEFNQELISVHAKKDRVRLLKISADDLVIASQYCYFFGKTNYFRLSSREIDRQWNRFELGRVGFVNLIKISIQEGIKQIELGQGHYDYKLKLGANEYPLQSILVAPNSWGIKIKIKIFLWFSHVLNVVYYKIWFCRLAKKIPYTCRRPLWKIWIRTRI